jgi:ribosomal protein S18 acetylase RimI-like enzyme
MITRLASADHPHLLRLLEEDGVQNVYLLSLSEHGLPRGDLVGYRQGGKLSAVLLIGANVVLYATRPWGTPAWTEAVAALGAYARSREMAGRIIVGERAIVDAFFDVYRERGKNARWIHGQHVFEVQQTELLAVDDPGLRKATLDDLDAVVEAEAQLVHHELGIDPHQRDLSTFSARVAERVARGHVFAHFGDQGNVLFKADISCRTARVVQIGGVFTSPEARRRGLARRGLSETCRRIFAADPTPPDIMLYVNDFNTPAIALYEGLGFRRTFDFRSILIEE